MKVTLKFLKKHDACEHGIIWFKNQKETDPIKLIHKLIAEKRFSWANWGITRLLDKLDCVRYAVFAAELTLPIFEKEYPDDKGPMDVIKAVKNYIANPTEQNSVTGCTAAAVAAAVVSAVHYVPDAANAVVSAAYYATRAADCTTHAAIAAVYADYYANYFAVRASDCAARAADYAADAAGADTVIYKKILDYGLSLIQN